MNKTKIEWCDSTLNPVVGCTFNCTYCYARRLNNRFKYIEDWNKPQFFPERLKQLNSKKSKNIFMNSMSDIADWKQSWITLTSIQMELNSQHNYIFLTKRPKELIRRLPEFLGLLNRSNLWIGVSVTSEFELSRISSLSTLKDYYELACNLFVSIEPIHGDVFEYYDVDPQLDTPGQVLIDFNWIIIGAETGNRVNKIKPNKKWIDRIVYIARSWRHKVFMKDSLISIIGEENMLRELPKELVHK